MGGCDSGDKKGWNSVASSSEAAKDTQTDRPTTRSVTQTPENASYSLTVALPNPAATDRLGAALGRRLQTGDVLALTGDLGAGKSALSRAAIRARLDDPGAEVPSPTFTLIQVYEAVDFEIWHVDLYRLEGETDAIELGLDEAFYAAACLIEWPDRLGAALPPHSLHIEILQDGEGRIAHLTGPASWTDRLKDLETHV